VTEEQHQAETQLDQEKKHHKTLGTNRGIETMFRSAYRVQMDLTSLADNKANMMISINGIIISITLVSIVYAILAARPRVSHKLITLEDLRHSQGNILFFGNFANMREHEFVEGMSQLMQDKTVTYETMMRNIYGLGVVLNKKFALLQVAYTSFMIALILGVTSFIGVFIWILQQPR
jgi:hypothetical protein